MNPEFTPAAYEMLDFVEASVVVRTFDGIIRYWNQAATSLYGRTAECALGRLVNEVFNTELDTDFDYWLTHDKWEGETVRRHSNGRLLPIKVKCSVRRDARGEACYIVETSQELNPRTADSLTLERSEYRYRNMFNAMAASFWELDFTDVGSIIRSLNLSGEDEVREYLRTHPECVRDLMIVTRVVDVNEQTVTLFGRGDKEEILAATLDVFWPKASSRVFADAVCSALAGHSSFAKETRLRRIDGSEFDALFTCAFPTDNLAKGLLMTGVLDLSARNQAYEARAQSERQYQHLFQVMTVSFWQMDISRLNEMFDTLRSQGVDNLSAYIDEHPEFVRMAMDVFVAVDVNERGITQFGATNRSQLLGPITRYWKQGCEVFRHSIEAVFSGANEFQSETKMLTVDGREIDVLYFVSAPEQMRESGMVLIGNLDISEQVASRNKLAHLRADLAHSARISMLGELMASIAHEINQPLSAIRTNGEAGLRWLDRAVPNLVEVRRITEEVVSNAQRASTIISRIHSMASHSTAEHDWHPVNSLIQETLQFLHAELQAHNVKTKVDLVSRYFHIYVDRILMQQVLVNLILNAVQAMSSSEKTHKELCISTRAIGSSLTISVKDNGSGIAPEHFGHLFDSFFTTKGTGMGMGLPICRSIIESFEATIKVENVPTGGACFSIVIATRDDTKCTHA